MKQAVKARLRPAQLSVIDVYAQALMSCIDFTPCSMNRRIGLRRNACIPVLQHFRGAGHHGVVCLCPSHCNLAQTLATKHLVRPVSRATYMVTHRGCHVNGSQHHSGVHAPTSFRKEHWTLIQNRNRQQVSIPIDF